MQKQISSREWLVQFVLDLLYIVFIFFVIRGIWYLTGLSEWRLMAGFILAVILGIGRRVEYNERKLWRHISITGRQSVLAGKKI